MHVLKIRIVYKISPKACDSLCFWLLRLLFKCDVYVSCVKWAKRSALFLTHRVYVHKMYMYGWDQIVLVIMANV